MLRKLAERSLQSSLTTSRALAVSRRTLRTQPSLQHATSLSTLSTPKLRLRSTAVARLSLTNALQKRGATTGWDRPDLKHEKEVGSKKLEAHPELVSSTSSIHPLNSEIGQSAAQKDVDMGAGIKGDLNTIRETFSMDEVPKKALYLGLAGTIPYLSTSIATVACSFEINQAHAYGQGYFLSESEAHRILEILEPLQVGYGAVIISFLGAIHWGLEWAKYGGEQGYPRYAIGVLAPAIAWPTVLLPATYALITQFLAFNWLYYADARATRRGWTPPWYGTYRFVLTFIVGGSIILSLIGRGEIAQRSSTLPKANERISGLHEEYEEKLKEKESGHTKKLKSENKDKGSKPAPAPAKDEDEDEDEDEGKDDGGKGGDESEDGEESKDEGKEKEEGDDNDKDEGKDEDKDDAKKEDKDEGKDEGKDDGKDEDKEKAEDKKKKA